ncbi:hypothetical protein O2K51_12075 [Apibacter raozihei]|uniref:hypothetical protein n=1 Tax=Apibacter raozihei TaxID=2500547 RepID=UPI000FE37FA7|nr:hypothetical protein [Apibacter raozihei]
MHTNYLIYNTIDKIEVFDLEKGLIFHVNRKQSILDKYRLEYCDINENTFFIIEKYDFLLYSTRKVIFNELGYRAVFDKKGILSFEGREIRFISQNYFRTKEIIYMNNIAIGEINRIKFTQEIEEYEIVLNGEIEENKLLILISFCLKSNFNFN